VVREEGGGGRARRAVDRAVGAPLGARLGDAYSIPTASGCTAPVDVSMTMRTTCRPLACVCWRLVGLCAWVRRTLRPPRCVSTGPVVVRLAEMAT
jgi:hypothetical protein